MLGTFMQALEKNHPMVVSRVPFCEKRTQEAGTPVVAVENAVDLKKTGLSTRIRFGIATQDACVIYQECQCKDLNKPRFAIVRKSCNDFCPHGWTLHKLEFPHITDFRLSEIHKRAQRALGNIIQNLKSYPGDDFVYECIFGQSISERYETDENIGRHWWTPLYYTAEELRKLMADALNVPLPKVLPESIDPELLHLVHHGISIESDWVIHFSTARVPNKKNRVKLDTIETFCNITPQAEPGGPLLYKRDTPSSRETARNRAVWIFFHEQDWGKYNLLWNNCEHLSRMCKVGHKESRQVRNTFGKLVIAAAGVLLPQAKVTKIVALGLPFLLNGPLKGRLMKNYIPLPFEA